MRYALLLAALLAPAAAAQLPPHPALDAPRDATSGDAARGATFDLFASWAPAPAWMGSVDFDAELYGGGMARGRFFLIGNATTTPEDDAPVEIRFDEDEVTLAPVFTVSDNWIATSVGTFRGSAWDVSDPERPRRLNVAFTERGDTPNADGVWGPDASSQGDLELLYVMNSDYDGTGETYLGNNLFTTPMDILYGWFPRLAPGRELYETSPAALSVELAYVRDLAAVADDGTVSLSWAYDLPDGAAFRVVRAEDDGPLVEVAEVPIGARSFDDVGLSPEPLYRYRVLVVDDAGAPIHTSAEVSTRATVRLGVDLVGVYDERSGYADVWGYTAPDGREYGLVALQSSGLVIVDVTDDVPVEVGFVPTAQGAFDSKDVKVYEQYAYLVNEGGPMQIIDLTDPANPVEVGQLLTDLSGGGDHGSHNVLVADDHLWTTGGPAPGGVQVWALQPDPTAPTFVGEAQPFYYHDFEVRDGIGFGPGIYGDGIDVLDVSDPANISLITRFNYPGSGAHNTCTTPDLSHVYVGDEIGSAGNWTRVFDLSDLDDVEFVGDLVVDGQAAVHNCYVHDGLLYVAHYTEGLQVFDLSDPAAPTRVAFYDTYTDSGYGYNGAWSVYPYFASGKVLVSDRTYGLFVLRVTPPVDAAGGPAAAELALAAAPNPARGATELSFRLGAPADVELAVYDALGRRVAVVLDGALGAGDHAARLDASALPSGLYLVRLTAGDRTATRSVVLAR